MPANSASRPGAPGGGHSTQAGAGLLAVPAAAAPEFAVAPPAVAGVPPRLALGDAPIVPLPLTDPIVPAEVEPVGVDGEVVDGSDGSATAPEAERLLVPGGAAVCAAAAPASSTVDNNARSGARIELPAVKPSPSMC